MSDNSSVKVAVRLRPLVNHEIEKGCKNILEVHKDLSQIRVKDTDKAFTFNYVLDTDASQKDLYNLCVKNVIPNLFQGFNLTILAYGQTGSGKTFSMGTTYSGNEEMGVIPRSVKQIYEFVKDNFVFDFTITVSFIELYQEVLYDLLSEKPREQCILEIREDPQKGICIPGLTEIPVENAHDIFNCLIKGSSGRATAATNMNAQSSRSHAIFTLNICMQARNNSEENKTAKFHLVDLAGSERPKKTGAVGNTFKEGVNINKGLLVLGNVISILGEERQEKFVPYRDSNLTRLLKDSLGGNSITLMIACVSPADYNIDETISTLRYADRAKRIKNKPVINQDPVTAQINQLQKTIKKLQLQIIGQGGPAVSSEEVALKKENAELKAKVRDLTHKLSSALNDKAGLLDKHLVLQNANETLAKKMLELKDVTLSAIDSDTSRFFEIKRQFDDLEEERKKAEAEMKVHEADTSNLIENNNCNEAQAKEIVDVQETYATRQIELNNELKDVMKNLAMKELLAKELEKNVKHMVDYENIRQNELRVEALEKEKSELLQQLKNVQHNAVPSKLADDRRKRVKELENQIHELTRKLNEQNRLIRLKEKDEAKIKQLNHEILQMKQNRIKLVKNMKEESERFRTWKLQRDREMAKLRQEDVKKKNQIQKMQTMHLKQQNVLKRKVEEAVAANKRLKDAMATRKAAQEHKFSGRLEKVTNWLKQEVEVVLGMTETEVTLAVLLEDRAMLQKQLNMLKSDSNPDLMHIKTMEEDIELRSVQIQDMQQKLLDAKEDEKNKLINFDNVQTMAEAKQTMKVLLDELVEIKKKECGLKFKSIELENVPSEDHHERNGLEEKLKQVQAKHSEAVKRLEQLEHEYEEKISILLGQLRGVEMRASTMESDNLNSIIKMQQKKIENMQRDLEEQQKKIEDEKIPLITIEKDFTLPRRTQTLSSLQNIEKISDANGGVVSAKDVTPPKRVKLQSQSANDTFIVDDTEKENFKSPPGLLDETFFEDDDYSKDPDWVKTPIGKRVTIERKDPLLHKTTTSAEFEAVKEKAASKRSSGGGCACTTGCSGRCGCRRTGKECLEHCKCNKLACLNRGHEGSKSMEEPSGFKKPRMKI